MVRTAAACCFCTTADAMHTVLQLFRGTWYIFYTYTRKVLPPVLSTCPLHTNSGCGKERRILIGPWWPAKAALVRNYLKVYWARAGGLSAVVVVVVVVVVVSHIQRIGCQPEKNYFTRWPIPLVVCWTGKKKEKKKKSGSAPSSPPHAARMGGRTRRSWPVILPAFLFFPSIP